MAVETLAVTAGVLAAEVLHDPARRVAEQLSPVEKRSLGWRDTKNLVDRAQACAACHVGTAGSDVNHDLIAAGHPPLKFEFGAYHAALPRHWSDRKDRALYPDLEARAWRIGQIVSAQAALEVLAHRAEAAIAQKQPWPEFAEYDCFACHHALHADGWRQKRSGQRRPGALPWGTWYFSMLPRALDADLAGWPELQQAMEKPLPPSAPVRSQAIAVRERLGPLLDNATAEPILQPRHLLDRFQQILFKERTRTGNWDEATQLYQGLVAHLDCWRAADFAAANDNERQSALRALAKSLARRAGQTAAWDYNPDAVAQQLEALHRLGGQ